MKKITKKILKENIGKEIIVVELVLNNKNENSVNEFWLCETLEEAYNEEKEMNEKNNDKNYKYIVAEYTVQEDLSLEN